MQYREDWSSPESIENWFTILKLECAPDYLISLFTYSFLFGMGIGSLIFPRLADLVGRRTTYFLGLIMHIILTGCLLVLKDPNWFYAIIFLMGIEQPARFLVGYIYLSELCPERHRPLVTSVALFFVAQAVTISCVYFMTISKNWLWLEIAGLGISFLAMFGICFTEESPRYLIANEKYKLALKSFKRIARRNGKRFNHIMF